MNYRNYKFYARADHDADTTIVHDINMQDPISSIVLGFELHKTDHIVTLHPMASIKKIELIDGSDVLWSLDGYESEALDWYNNGGQLRSNYNMQLTASTVSRYIGLHFGRYLFDPEYAFDPKRFTNPQLRITLDIDAWAAAGDHIYVTGWANLFDEGRTDLKGFFMSKELKQWTMADNTHEYTDLPLDFPYEGIYVRAYLAGTEPNSCIQNIKISEDQDKKIPFDMGGQEVLRCMLNEYPPVKEDIWFSPHTVARYSWVTPTTRVTALGQPWAAAAADQGTTCYEGDGGRLAVITKTAASNTQLHVWGYIPHCVYRLPCSIKNDPSSYYDVSRLGSLRADIEGAAAAQGFIFLQQLRRY
jgi:hypothetical protein